jgi:hypothetical protein
VCWRRSRSYRGPRHRHGYIPGYPTPEEEDFFKAAGFPFVAPTERDELVARI